MSACPHRLVCVTSTRHVQTAMGPILVLAIPAILGTVSRVWMSMSVPSPLTLALRPPLLASTPMVPTSADALPATLLAPPPPLATT